MCACGYAGMRAFVRAFVWCSQEKKIKRNEWMSIQTSFIENELTEKFMQQIVIYHTQHTHTHTFIPRVLIFTHNFLFVFYVEVSFNFSSIRFWCVLLSKRNVWINNYQLELSWIPCSLLQQSLKYTYIVRSANERKWVARVVGKFHVYFAFFPSTSLQQKKWFRLSFPGEMKITFYLAIFPWEKWNQSKQWNGTESRTSPKVTHVIKKFRIERKTNFLYFA